MDVTLEIVGLAILKFECLRQGHARFSSFMVAFLENIKNRANSGPPSFRRDKFRGPFRRPNEIIVK